MKTLPLLTDHEPFKAVLSRRDQLAQALAAVEAELATTTRKEHEATLADEIAADPAIVDKVNADLLRKVDELEARQRVLQLATNKVNEELNKARQGAIKKIIDAATPQFRQLLANLIEALAKAAAANKALRAFLDTIEQTAGTVAHPLAWAAIFSPLDTVIPSCGLELWLSELLSLDLVDAKHVRKFWPNWHEANWHEQR